MNTTTRCRNGARMPWPPRSSAAAVPADSVRAIGRGKAFPVASNTTPAGRQQNRRVEIVFSDASGRFAQSEPGEPARR